MFDYPVTIAKDGNHFLVTFKDIPEAITFGKTKQQALEKAIDALETGLSFYIEARKQLPKPSKPKRGQKTVRPTALECAKLGIYKVMVDQGIKKAELARRLGWHTPQVDRLFDLHHASKFDQIEAAAAVLNRHIEIRIAA